MSSLSSPTTTTSTISLTQCSSSPSSSAAQPSLPQKKTRNRGKQKLPPITSEEAEKNFLKNELNAAKARIVILDQNIIDKDQELSVVWARVKILEEKQNKDILDKYFPHSSNNQTKNKPTTCCPSPRARAPPACAPPPPSCSRCAPISCCTRPPQCPKSNHNISGQFCSDFEISTSNTLDDIKAKVEAVVLDVESLKNKIMNYQPSYETTSLLPDIEDQNNDQMSDNKYAKSDDSIVSIEEFLCPISDPNTKAPLNFQDLTNQQTELMLL